MMTILLQQNKTIIQVSKEVREKLKSNKLVPREAYEDVLRRILNMPKRRYLGDKIENE